MNKQNEFLCPYCNVELVPTGHSSGACNGWSCINCGHEEPEMGSFSLSGRLNVDLTCYCSNCKDSREISKFRIEKKKNLFYVSGILSGDQSEPIIKQANGKLIRSFNLLIYKDRKFNAIFKGVKKVTHDLIILLRKNEIIHEGKIFKRTGKFEQIKEGALIEYKSLSGKKKITISTVYGESSYPSCFSDELKFYNPK